MNVAPTFSVILVTRDRPGLLRDALASVARQSLPPAEVRIADEGDLPVDPVPADGLLEVTVLRVSAGRAGAARNAAARGARGEVLAFLDDDDRWRPDHLAGLSRAFEDASLDVAWRDAAVVREEVTPRGERIERARRPIARDWDPAMMRDNDYIPTSALAVRRARFEALGGFDPAFRFSEDWDFLLRAARATAPRRVPGETVEIRMRAQGNLSADHGPERLDCLRRLAERHGLPPLEPRTFWEVAAIAGGAGA